MTIYTKNINNNAEEYLKAEREMTIVHCGKF